MMFDGVLTAHESVCWFKKKRKKGSMLKVDFMKAYESIRWVFIEHMLIQIVVGPKMRQC